MTGDIIDLIRNCGLSQAEIARKSGVSRVQINRIMNGNVAIHEQTREKLRAALTNHSVPIRESALAAYRRSIQTRLGKKSFTGLGIPGLPKQDLDSIFVAPKVVRHTATQDCDPDVLASNVAREPYEKAIRETTPLEIDQLVLASPRLVLIGCPGAGKTTTLDYMAVKTAQGKLFERECLPVVVRLPEFAAALEISPSTDFVSWIIARAEQLDCPGVGEELYEWLQSRDKTVLFLFDGLDEVPNENDRRKLVETTVDFVRRYPGNRFCVTSRPIGFDETPWSAAGFEVIRLLEYGDDQISQAITKWSQILGHTDPEDVKAVGEKLIAAICESPRVRQIAANPLILTILIFLCYSRGYALPRRRVDLYAKVTEVFLDSWEASKRHSNVFSETLNIDLDTRELSWLISDVALEMQRRGLVLAKRWWIEQRIEETLTARIGLENHSAKDATGRILRFISDRSGLLEERALDLYAFSHRTLQEYFAATGAINEADSGSSQALTKLIRPYMYQPDWTEVVCLIASQITPPRAEELVRVILDDPDPSGRFLHRGPLLAARCLLDGATIASRRVVNQLFRAFDELGRSKWLGITLEALSILRQFQDTRFKENASSAINRILEGARQHLEHEEYATLLLSPDSPDVDVEVRGVAGREIKRSAIIEFRIALNALSTQFHIPNFELIADDQEAWHQDAIAVIDDPRICLAAKQAALQQMGAFARLQHTKTYRRSRVRLKYIARDKTKDDELRATAIRVLGSCASGPLGATRVLLGILQSEDKMSVRAAAAFALRNVATSEQRVKNILFQFLQCSNSEVMRVAAAYALRDVAGFDDAVKAELLRLADEQGASKELQSACVRALETAIKNSRDVRERYRQWAFEDDIKTRIACQVLAEAILEGNILSWDAALVDRVEEVLRSIGRSDRQLGRPCAHALWALKSLVNVREARFRLRVESVISDCLAQFVDRIRWAFIFGSVARNEQSDCSDVDLALIGDVTMREVSSAIRQAEYSLGRTVNPVIYSYESFVEKLHAGDPFVTEVVRQAKIAIRIGDRTLTDEELNDELRVLEADRLAGS